MFLDLDAQVGAINAALKPLLSWTDAILQGSYTDSDGVTSVFVPPTILDPIPATRRIRNGILQSRFENTRNIRIVIAELETQLGRVRAALEQHEAAVGNALAPVTGLPTELMRQIFQYAVDATPAFSPQSRHSSSPSRHNTLMLVRISHVSRVWRNIIIGLPELWTTLRIPYNRISLFPSLSVRSIHHPIHLTITHPTEEPSRLIVLPPYRLVDLPPEAENASRIASISLLGGSPGWGQRLEIAPKGYLPHLKLEQLIVKRDHSAFSKERTLEWMISTRLLEVSGTRLLNKDRHVFYRLEEVSMSNVSDCAVVEMLALLEGCVPNLKRLRLADIWAPGYLEDGCKSDEVPDAGVMAPIPTMIGRGLEQLQIDECFPGVMRFFAGASLPNLRSLEVRITQKHSVGMSSINACQYGYRAWWDIVLHSTKLSALSLSLGDTYFPSIFDLLSPSNRGLPLPNLNSLRLHINAYYVWEPRSEGFLSDICGCFRYRMQERLMAGIPPLKHLSVSRELLACGNGLQREPWWTENVGALEVL